MKRRSLLIGIAVPAVIALVAFVVWWGFLRESSFRPPKPLTTDEKLELIHGNNIAIGQLENGEFDAPAEFFEDMVQRLPDEPLGHRNLVIARAAPTSNGGLGMSNADQKKLLDALDQMLAVEADNPQAQHLAGRILFLLVRQRGQESLLEQARDYLEKAVRGKPADAGPLFDLYLLEKSSDPSVRLSSQASEALTKAYHRDEDNVVLLWEMLLAEAALRSKRTIAMIEALLKVLPAGSAEVEAARATLRGVAQQWAAGAVKDLSDVFPDILQAFNVLKSEPAYLQQLARLQPHPQSFVLHDFTEAFYKDLPTESATPIQVTFKLKTVDLSSAVAPKAVAVDDVNSDGHLATVTLHSEGDHTRVEVVPEKGGMPIEPITVPGKYTMLQLVDLDLDFGKNMEPPDLDLVLAGPSGLRFLENRLEAGKRRWVDRTDDLKLPNLAGLRWYLVCDIDHDGMIDIVVGLEKGIIVLRNHGGWSFADITARSPGLDKLETIAAVFGDFDLDGDLDILCLDNGGKIILLENQGGGVVVPRPQKLVIPGAKCLHAFDAGNKGLLNLVVGHDRAASLFIRDGSGHWSKLLGLNTGAAVLDAGSLDYDNDGLIDVWLRTADPKKPLRLFRNNGETFTETTGILPELPAITSAPVVIDRNADGALDFLLTNADGLRELLNEGGNKNNWLDVRLRSTNMTDMGAGKTAMCNFAGIGSSLELRSGRHSQRQFVQGGVTHFGLGKRDRVDVLRTLWTNRVPQNLLRPKPNNLIVEVQRSKSW